MDDLISRAAAIAQIKENYCHWCDHIDLCQSCETQDCIATIEQQVPAVDAVPVVQRWISVKDRLPEVAGWYIVFYNGSAMQVAFFKGKKWPFNNHYHTITHWMPLPEPPKMDGEADG